MHILKLTKPDGRKITLYSRSPISDIAAAPSPGEAISANPHLRWHPLRGEWVAYAAYRQGRTFMPPPEYNPLMPTTDPKNPTELPAGKYDVAVFDNKFPSLTFSAHDAPEFFVDTLPANGKCEVIVFTQDPKSFLGALPLDHIELLLEVWGDRTNAISNEGAIQYVLPFENRGVEVGVTLHHPHGQIYAYPFIPPVPQRMQLQQQDYYDANKRSLLECLIQEEISSKERIIFESEHAVAFVPICARYPYEVWVAPVKQVASFSALKKAQRSDLARALKTVLLKYENLWERSFPYLMAWYQAPVDDRDHPEWHLHAQFYPPYRTRDRLKYLAGTELAAGMFANDALPEEKAKELQQVNIHF